MIHNELQQRSTKSFRTLINVRLSSHQHIALFPLPIFCVLFPTVSINKSPFQDLASLLKNRMNIGYSASAKSSNDDLIARLEASLRKSGTLRGTPAKSQTTSAPKSLMDSSCDDQVCSTETWELGTKFISHWLWAHAEIR